MESRGACIQSGSRVSRTCIPEAVASALSKAKPTPGPDAVLLVRSTYPVPVHLVTVTNWNEKRKIIELAQAEEVRVILVNSMLLLVGIPPLVARNSSRSAVPRSTSN